MTAAAFAIQWHIPKRMARTLPWVRVQSVSSRRRKAGQVRVATRKLHSGPYLSWFLETTDPWLFEVAAPPGAVAGEDIGDPACPLLSSRRSELLANPYRHPNNWPEWLFEVEAVRTAEATAPWHLALARTDPPPPS